MPGSYGEGESMRAEVDRRLRDVANDDRVALGSLLLVACENGNSDEPRPSPCDRIGSENPDLVGARTEGSNVVDGGLQRTARISGRDSTTT